MVTAARDIREGQSGVKDPLARLRELVLDGRLGVCGPSHNLPESGFLACVEELRSGDDRLDPTDILIVSAALCCEACDQFYTDDRVMLNSSVLRRAAEVRGVRIINPI
jgi:hypothetical protein